MHYITSLTALSNYGVKKLIAPWNSLLPDYQQVEIPETIVWSKQSKSVFFIGIFALIFTCLFFWTTSSRLSTYIWIFVLQVHQFSVGDLVQILDSVQQVKDFQKGHGEWTDNMRTVSSHHVLQTYIIGVGYWKIGSWVQMSSRPRQDRVSNFHFIVSRKDQLCFNPLHSVSN